MESMQIFGIELRRANNMKAVYADVDKILQRDSSDFKIVSNDVKYMAVTHSLQDMLRSEKHFSICTVQECAKVAQIVIPRERMDVYQTQHCISWSAMLPEFRTKLIAMLLDDFRPILEPR